MAARSGEPGRVPAPPAQTNQDVQTRDVASDTVDTYLEIAPDGRVKFKVKIGQAQFNQAGSSACSGNGR